MQCDRLTHSIWATGVLGGWKTENCSRRQAQKEAAQLAEDVINAGQKADDLSRKMHDVEPQERDQLSEQDIAQRLIMKLPVNFLQL